MKVIQLSAIIFIVINGCNGQSKKTEFRTFKDDQMGWSVDYPDYLRILSDTEIAAYEGRAEGPLEETIGEEIEYNHQNLIWLLKDRFNSFSSNSQPYDSEIDGPFEENQKMLNEAILETYKNQGIEFDSEFGTYNIDGLGFSSMTTKLYTPDRSKVILTQIVFERLFSNSRTLTLNINYNNPMDKEILMKIVDSSKLTIRN
ncbi:MAG: hypothetical protein RIC80_10645 [Cyclobacteriaceae bacterium]